MTKAFFTWKGSLAQRRDMHGENGLWKGETEEGKKKGRKEQEQNPFDKKGKMQS